jgi:L-lactate dehydrogenase
MPVEQFAAHMGRPLTPEAKAAIENGVRNAAYKIIDGKGATYYGIGAGLARLGRVILADERQVFTVSTINDDIEGVKQVALSLPRVIASRGIVSDIPPRLDDGERRALRRSAETLRQAADAIAL